MIELLVQPPAIISQVPHQTIFRDDYTQGCSGFTPSQNQDIGYAAANHLAAFTRSKTDSLVIFFAREFDQLDEPRLRRLYNFINLPNEHNKYVFFCPNSNSDRETTGFWGSDIVREISRFLGFPTNNQSHLIRDMGLVPVGSIHRGFLYRVPPPF